MAVLTVYLNVNCKVSNTSSSTTCATTTGSMVLTVSLLQILCLISLKLFALFAASFIRQMEENSGVSFVQAQVALARQWIGQPNPGVKTQDKVVVKKPEPTGEAMLVGDKTEVKTEEVPLPASEEEAKDIIERFEKGAEGVRSDSEVADTVCQHRLKDETSLLDEKWLGTAEEELGWYVSTNCATLKSLNTDVDLLYFSYVSELLYIHSKLMIVDDRRVIVSPMPNVFPNSN